MQLDNLACNVKAQAHAGQVVRAVGLMKTVKDIRSLVGGNPHALIGNGKPDVTFRVLLESNRHHAALGTELHGVPEQNGDYLAKPNRIHDDFEVLGPVIDKRVGAAPAVLGQRRLNQVD
jgi:hypothetical protein